MVYSIKCNISKFFFFKDSKIFIGWTQTPSATWTNKYIHTELQTYMYIQYPKYIYQIYQTKLSNTVRHPSSWPIDGRTSWSCSNTNHIDNKGYYWTYRCFVHISRGWCTLYGSNTKMLTRYWQREIKAKFNTLWLLKSRSFEYKRPTPPTGNEQSNSSTSYKS